MASVHAATLTDPVVNLGTITYTSSTPGTRTFNITTGGSPTGKTYSASSSGDGTVTESVSYTGLVATNLKKYGQAKYAHIRLLEQNPTPPPDDCGTLTITNLQVKTGYPDHASFGKSGGNPSTISGYTNGIFFPFVATVTPTPNKGNCTITQTYSIFRFAEGGAAEPADSEYQPFSITFSITLITPVSAFEHDTGASLDFGTFCKSSQTQTLTVTTAGAAGSHSTLCSPTNVSADSFTVTLPTSTNFSVSLPSQAVDISNGQNKVLVNNFTSSCDGGGCTVTGASKQFFVGGTITVYPTATVGEYQGSYPVSITY